MRWLGIAFLLIFLGGALHWDWPFLRGPRRYATGRVTGHRRSLSDDGETFGAICEFTAEDGTCHEAIDILYTAKPRPPLGSALRIVYPADRPQRARVHRPWVHLGLYSFVAVCLLLLLFGPVER
jgi:hypothetical protein